VDSRYTYIGINKQIIKEKKIKIEPIDRSFEVFNTDEPRPEKLQDLHH